MKQSFTRAYGHNTVTTGTNLRADWPRNRGSIFGGGKRFISDQKIVSENIQTPI